MQPMKTDSSETPNAWLHRFARSVTSQGGEDGIIEKTLEVIGIPNQWCVEFGSWDGKYLSNTYNLISNHGYSAVLIEGSSKRYDVLKKNFRANPRVIPVNALVGFEQHNCLDRILENTAAPKDFDLLSIDIDGNDYHVWEAMRKYVPKVVVIEFNPTIPPNVEFVQPRDMCITQGSSLLSMVRLAKSKEYELVAVESANAVFVGEKYFDLFGIKDNSVDSIWTTSSSAITNIFFGFDGTVFLRGLSVHPWLQIPIMESRMQLLPAWARNRMGGQNYLLKKLAKIYHRMKKTK
jgi:hypothetical protein